MKVQSRALLSQTLGDHKHRRNILDDLPNSRDIYALYLVMFSQTFHLRRKSVIFSAVLAGEPWSWEVIGISQAALEVLSKKDYQYVGKTICRAHIVNRIDTANTIFNIPRPLPYQQLFRLLVKTGRTIITIRSENKSAAQLPHLHIDANRGLFKNQLISFSYGQNERNALRELHSSFKSGKEKLVKQADRLAIKITPYQKERAHEPAPKADGKRAIVGTIGKSKYLLDAGDGRIVLELKTGRNVARQALAFERILVPRREASKYAVKSLVSRWAQARNGVVA